ncbi:Uncharacterised protein [Bordetella pertussis]|nr:Uncharacterised protein [Bordetella pertussis]
MRAPTPLMWLRSSSDSGRASAISRRVASWKIT